LLLAIDAISLVLRFAHRAQLTYAEEGTTYGDVAPAEAAAQIEKTRSSSDRANCTLGPQALLADLQELGRR